jgi:hypothetical protein
VNSILLAATLGLVIPVFGTAQTSGRVDLKYDLEVKVSASDAEKSFLLTVREIEKLIDRQKTPRTMCPSPDGTPRACVSDAGEKNVYLGQYVSVVTNDPILVSSFDQIRGGRAELGWVPVQRIVSGNERLNSLEEQLANRQRLGCSEETAECDVVVEAVPKKKTERVLAVCSFSIIGNQWGASRGCEPVAIIGPKGTYLKAVVAFIPGRPIEPTELVTNIEFHVQSAISTNFRVAHVQRSVGQLPA